MPTVDAMVRAVAGPEALSNGGSKWSFVLDNGTMLCTFSEACTKAVQLDTQYTFEIEMAQNPGMSPKVLKVLKGSEVVWEPGGKGGFKGGSYDPTTEFAKHAVGTAGAIVGNVILAHAQKGESLPDVKQLIVEAMTEWAPLLHDELVSLKSQGLSTPSSGGGVSG